jgi:hypothetical protein
MRSKEVRKEGGKEKSPEFLLSLSEVREKPEEQRERGAEDKAGNDGEIERGVFAAMNEVAREAAKAERKFSAEIEKRANED